MANYLNLSAPWYSYKNDIKTVNISEGVTSIGNCAFYSCRSLTTVYYSCSHQQRENITIKGGNTYLTNATWYYNVVLDGEHIYDSTCDTDCNVCGHTREITHTYDNYCDNDCNICGYTREVPEHIYDNTCDTDCNECNLERKVPDHVYDGNCNVCGFERIPPHNCISTYDVNYHWKICVLCGISIDKTAHSFDYACDMDCSGCFYVRATEHTYAQQYDNDKH